jgi:hypothetical protein
MTNVHEVTRGGARRLVAVVLLALVALAVPVRPAAASTCGGLLQPACPAPPSTPVNGAGQKYGFNLDGLGWLDLPANGGVPRSAILQHDAASGASYVRTGLDWEWYEPQQGNVQPGFLAAEDQNYNDHLSVGIKEVMILMGTPYWAVVPQGRNADDPTGVPHCMDYGAAPNRPSNNCFAPPNIDDPAIRAAWVGWVQTVANRYPQLAAIEVWNEPNLEWFWMMDQDPALYARLVRITADAVRAVQPNMKVLAAGIAPWTLASTADTSNDVDFLNALYDEPGVGASAFDAISYHPYPCNNGVGSYTSTNVAQFTSRVRSVRNAHADTAKPLWITETGVTSVDQNITCGTSFNEAEQRLALAYTLDWTKQQHATFGDLPVVLVHTLMNRKNRVLITQSSGDAEGEFGLVAWSQDLITKVATVQDKPAFATVSCKFKGTC